MLPSVAQPPFPLQAFLPLQPAAPALHPPWPLQSFLPEQPCLAIFFSIDFLCLWLLGFTGVIADPELPPLEALSAYATPERSVAEKTPAEISACNCFLVIVTPLFVVRG